MLTIATFRSSAFNVDQPKSYFINPDSYGDDAAKWIIRRLNDREVDTDSSPSQEDFGWYFDFETSAGAHCCVIGYRPSEHGRQDDGTWIVWLERSAGFIGSLMGRRRKVAAAAVRVLHEALSQGPEIRDLLWHDRRQFDEACSESGQSSPLDGSA